MKKFIPPYLFFICVLFMVLINRIFPIKQLVPESYGFFGYLILVAGLIMMIKIGTTFRERKTEISPFGKPKKLITDGLFKYSRNPIYLGFTLALIGIWMVLGSLTPLIGVIVFQIGINGFYIPMEEKNMEAAFGQQYLDYKNKVRRWL